MQYFQRIQDPHISRALRDVVDELNQLRETTTTISSGGQVVKDLTDRLKTLEAIVVQLQAQLTPGGTIISK